MSRRYAPIPFDAGDTAFCVAMLPRCSRTFAACIRMLPGQLAHEVLVAYLLCRIADTAEDTSDLAVADKQRLLGIFSASLAGTDPEAAEADLSAWRSTFAAARNDDELLGREAARTLREFRRMPAPSRDAVRPWVQEMCAGMADFAAIQAEVQPGKVIALRSIEDLDRYCYYVAGTVGHLLTGLFAVHSRWIRGERLQRLKALSTSFGLGLQLTNIIKDVADDRTRGWSFVPRQACQLAGIDPEDLLDPAKSREARQAMNLLITKAKGHLKDALAYSTALPRRDYRIRLFCLVPLYFAVRTLALAERDDRLLDPTHKVKITRGEVYRTIAMTYLVAPNNHLCRAYYRQLIGKRRTTQ